MSSDEQPSSKRPRLDEDEGADGVLMVAEEDAIGEDYLDGDAFITPEERERRAAEERRLKRKQRLQELQQKQRGGGEQQTEDDDDDNARKAPPVASPAASAAPGMQNGFADEPGVSAAATTATVSSKPTPNDEDDEFDMFSSSVSPTDPAGASTKGTQQHAQRGVEQQDWDDAEGYYKAVIGETIHLDPQNHSNHSEDAVAAAYSASTSITFRVSGVIGKGVFSTVLKCTTVSNSSSVELPPVTALKFIRHNETMARAALTEIEMLQRLKGSPGIVPMLLPTNQTPLEHRGHTILVFSFMQYNLRDVLQKFGKGVGLSLQAVRSYFGQLLAAATHLKRHGIIHCDCKLNSAVCLLCFARKTVPASHIYVALCVF